MSDKRTALEEAADGRYCRAHGEGWHAFKEGVEWLAKLLTNEMCQEMIEDGKELKEIGLNNFLGAALSECISCNQRWLDRIEELVSIKEDK